MQQRDTVTKAPRVRGKSSTQDILGLNTNHKIKRRWADHYRRLTALRDSFSGTKNAQTDSAREELPSFSEHMADAATDSYDRDCALAMLSSAQSALYEIEQALNRIHNDTYGICELTGQPIEPDRLKAVPWTRYCAGAQARLEAHGARPRVQLGVLGSCLHAVDSQESEEDGEAIAEFQQEREAA